MSAPCVGTIIPRAIIPIITRGELRNIIDASQIDLCRDESRFIASYASYARLSESGTSGHERQKQKKKRKKKKKKTASEYYEQAVFMHTHKFIRPANISVRSIALTRCKRARIETLVQAYRG